MPKRRKSEYAKAVAVADAAIGRPPARGWRDDMLEAAKVGELQQAWRDMAPEERQALMHTAIRKAAVRPAVAYPTLAPGRTVTIDPAECRRQLEALYRAMTPEQRAEYDRGAA